MRCWKRLAPNHPRKGIRAWNRPKKKAMVNTVRHKVRFRIAPLATDTVKQSIARLTASKMISTKYIMTVKTAGYTSGDSSG